MHQYKYAVTCALVASATSLIIGCNVGVMGGPSTYIKEIKTYQEEVSAGTAVLNSLTFFSLLLTGWISDCVGRRRTILLAAGIFFLGRLLMGVARSYVVLLEGRLVANIGIGSALMISPVYVAEISPAFSRGELSTLPEVFFNLGIFIGHIFNYFFPKVELDRGWIMILGLVAISSHLLAIGILIMPESPRWLVMRNRLNSAKRVLNMISNSEEDAAIQLADIKRAAVITEDDNVLELTPLCTGESMWDLFHPTRSVCHLLVCTIAMHLFKGAFGIETILRSPQIFKTLGLSNSYKKFVATIVIDSIKILGMLYPIFHLDQYGRRRLMLLSITGMFIALSSLAGCFDAINRGNANLSWAVVISMLVYIVSFSIGLGPITSQYGSEVFPLRLRSQGTAIGFSVELAVNEVSSIIFLRVCNEFSFGGAAFLYATIASVFWILFFIIMPETKGLKLEEIGCLFGKYIDWRAVVMEPEVQMQRINRFQSDATMSRPLSRALPTPF